MAWYGADPGGIDKFGVAALHDNGTFDTWCCSSVGEALDHIRQPKAVGIDCPLWWTSAEGGSRRADNLLRHPPFCVPSGTVQSVNSLRGAVIAQGLLLAVRLRKIDPRIKICETHPKALLFVLKLLKSPWPRIARCFGLHGDEPGNHERDALLGAVAAREGFSHRWTIDFAKERDEGEFDVTMEPVNYWWPAPTEVNEIRRRTD
jgi:predicted nuclease with RNAse H fold